uniref:ABC transporter transmembrane domain-containing protein n=1 Tax=Pseudobutyrivibrio sp. TaxID=2014367 RepID=UPI00386622AF
MLKRIFALSDGGAKDLKKGIAATAIYNILLMVPVGIMMMLVLEMLTGIDTGVFKTDFGVGGFIALTLIMYVIIFISQWIQYDKTYTVAYEESANRRLTLAEKIRKLPLSFFGEKNLADLTTTMMGDCTALERTFSNAIPLMLGTLTMFAISAVCLIVIDWRMGLCILAPVPVAALIVIYARKAQQKAEAANMEAK